MALDTYALLDAYLDSIQGDLWEGEIEHASVKDVPIPTIRHPEDVIVRVTLGALCGTDLHIYSGELGSTKTPWILGHEAIGIVIVVGSAVDVFKVGDKVVFLMPQARESSESKTQRACLAIFKVDFMDLEKILVRVWVAVKLSMYVSHLQMILSARLRMDQILMTVTTYI